MTSKIEPPEESWLNGGGETGKLVRAYDWSRSPLGPTRAWPQSLRTTVGLALSSSLPIAVIWGPDRVLIYNDGYSPLCGAKHPHAMGQDFRASWDSAWPVVGELFARALAGEASFLENCRMFLDRNGYPEETFFTFSFSPIRDESGGIAGVFHAVTETTAQILSERRTRTLRELAAHASEARSGDESLLLAAQALNDADLDLPFVLMLPPDSQVCPSLWSHNAETADLWPLREVARTLEVQQIDGLEEKLDAIHCGPYPETPRVGLALPIMLPGSSSAAGVMIAGVSSRLPPTESYRAFYELLASTVNAAYARAHAYEVERRRAEALLELDRAKTLRSAFLRGSRIYRASNWQRARELSDERSSRDVPTGDAELAPAYFDSARSGSVRRERAAPAHPVGRRQRRHARVRDAPALERVRRRGRTRRRARAPSGAPFSP